MHVQEAMTALFKPEVEGELFSPRSGLLLHDRVEQRFDVSPFVIVPEEVFNGTRPCRKIGM
jgi:hypothetical protein